MKVLLLPGANPKTMRWLEELCQQLNLNFDICQLVFRAFIKTHHEAEGTYSLRSSLWQKSGGEWKMIFHQGTKVEPFELSP